MPPTQKSILDDKARLAKLIAETAKKAAPMIDSGKWLAKSDAEELVVLWAKAGGLKLVNDTVAAFEKTNGVSPAIPDKLVKSLADGVAKQCPFKDLNRWVEDYFFIEFADSHKGDILLMNAEAVTDAMDGGGAGALKRIVRDAARVAIARKKPIRAEIIAAASKDSAFKSVVAKAAVALSEIAHAESQREREQKERKAAAEKRKKQQAVIDAAIKQAKDVFTKDAGALHRRVDALESMYNAIVKENKNPLITPPKGVLNQANNARAELSNLARYNSQGDFDGVISSRNKACEHIIKGTRELREFTKKTWTSVEILETVCKGVEIFRDGTFEVLKILTSMRTGGRGDPFTDAGIETIKSASNELGKVFAGTSKGWASARDQVFYDTAKEFIVSAAFGGIFGQTSLDKVFRKFSPDVAKILAPKFRHGWLKNVSLADLTEFVAKAMDSLAETLITAIMKGLASITDEGNLVKHLANKVYSHLEQIMSLNIWLDKNFYLRVGHALKGDKISQKDLERMLNDSSVRKLIDAHISKALKASPGKATAEGIGNLIVSNLTRDKKFRDLMEKQRR
ncbi:hypothetical protein M2103_001504 [Ereboglobus sp. PH5-5]|uniref:hypothetical protein n=1 Tax=Ereboglobus sp. PH5-5 TaxID=2940529 RepID=UPI00240507EE|nr:hypothetical protein [Ereboglobus sp. PH5-5]MDF9833281.1 hypothetical protein [Ereboglobus sp. PH5-5]